MIDLTDAYQREVTLARLEQERMATYKVLFERIDDEAQRLLVRHIALQIAHDQIAGMMRWGRITTWEMLALMAEQLLSESASVA